MPGGRASSQPAAGRAVVPASNRRAACETCRASCMPEEIYKGLRFELLAGLSKIRSRGTRKPNLRNKCEFLFLFYFMPTVAPLR